MRLFVHLCAGFSKQLPGFGILDLDARVEHQLVGFFEDAGNESIIEQGQFGLHGASLEI